MIIEIVIMSFGVLCCLLPSPWEYIILIAIGTRSILMKAISKAKEPPPPEVVHCCGGEKTGKRKKEKKVNVNEEGKSNPRENGSASVAAEAAQNTTAAGKRGRKQE